jgi:antitoxin FitA
MQQKTVRRSSQERSFAMNTLTIRKVPDDLHRSLRLRAAQNGRSAEAEVREILKNALKPERTLLDSLNEIREQLGGGVELDITRDKRPFRGASFE